MAYFAVTYDLHRVKDYKKLTDELERLSAARVALSVWFVQLNNTTAEVRDHFAKKIDNDDSLVVIPFTERPRAVRGMADGIAWLDKRFGKL